MKTLPSQVQVCSPLTQKAWSSHVARPSAVTVELLPPVWVHRPTNLPAQLAGGAAATGAIEARSNAAAGRQDGHVAFEVLHDGEAIRIAHQDLEDRHLEVHAPSGSISATSWVHGTARRGRPA
ncbi:hypothetical protein XI04_20275 [Bradyrhizobium sp. CCBAU 11430]|nr:hypothetical protein [Bradyrhizobium sp. CCBAU 25360]MDA9456508.1 hypothetical protein [Bradyrhizobium sp. CCBAU 21359]MDA9515382.1 hypothetical protein [Bradyrhizobium sp. CCBAU 11430]